MLSQNLGRRSCAPDPAGEITDVLAAYDSQSQSRYIQYILFVEYDNIFG